MKKNECKILKILIKKFNQLNYENNQSIYPG